jgi:glycogen(starch) synthase
VSLRAVRVLILSWEYPPIVEGGLARHVRKLSEQLVGDGVEVHVLTRGDRDRFRLPGEPLVPRVRLRRRVTEEDRHGVIVHRVREPDFPRGDVDAFIAWVDHMNEDMRAAGLELGGGFDLVHSHDWLVAAAARKLARHWKLPWLVTVHATEYGRHQGWVDKHPQSHIHGVERRMVRGADRVITCSAYMREHVADAFGLPAGGVTVIPNGIDPTDLQPVADLPRLRARFAAPGEKLVLLVGRLVYEKGFHLALEAMPGLIERLGGVRFLVAGTGTAEAELKAQARKLGLMEHGTFIGWTGDDVLHSLYRIADLCVVPSIYEPFGLVALEAMASGCPTIVADTGGLREVVPAGQRVGLRFRARDSASLSRMAEKLLGDDALRDRLVAQAREHVLQFDWADVARQTATVYDELRANRVTPGAQAGGHLPRASQRSTRTSRTPSTGPVLNEPKPGSDPL